MLVYQVHCESDDDQVISALYQASNDREASEKIQLYIRESVITKKISWLITIHRSDWEIDLSDLLVQSRQSIELKNLLLNPDKWPKDWIWMEQVDTTETGPDMDITAILDYFQDDGEPEVIEVIPGCIEFPSDSKDIAENVDKDHYPKAYLGGEITASNNPEEIGKRIQINAPGLKFIPWRPGRACLAMTRVVQNRQFESLKHERLLRESGWEVI